jgi:hypothetical protein
LGERAKAKPLVLYRKIVGFSTLQHGKSGKCKTTVKMSRILSIDGTGLPLIQQPGKRAAEEKTTKFD